MSCQECAALKQQLDDLKEFGEIPYIKELTEEIATLTKAEEKQRQKKEWYHEEHAKEILRRAELEKEVATLKGEIERLEDLYEATVRMN